MREYVIHYIPVRVHSGNGLSSRLLSVRVPARILLSERDDTGTEVFQRQHTGGGVREADEGKLDLYWYLI